MRWVIAIGHLPPDGISDPLTYLRDILTRLPEMKQSEIATITPAAWAKAQKTAAASKSVRVSA